MKSNLKKKGLIKALRVPVSGRPFVIKLNCKEIYNGAFWSPISSKSYSGIVILIEDNSVKIENGYHLKEDCGFQLYYIHISLHIIACLLLWLALLP